MKAQYNPSAAPELAVIKQEVEKFLSIEDIAAPSRTYEYAMARWLYIKLAKDFTNYSTMIIGSAIKRDHSTVVHALDALGFELSYNKDLQTKYDELLIIMADALHNNTLAIIDTKINKLKNKLASLEAIKTKLNYNELTYTEFKNQGHEQVFWS